MFNLPVDPRIEHLARVFCRQDQKDPDNVVPFEVPGAVNGHAGMIKGEWHQWRAYMQEAKRHVLAFEALTDLQAPH